MQLLFFIEIVISAKNQLVEGRSREWRAERDKAGRDCTENTGGNQKASYADIMWL